MAHSTNSAEETGIGTCVRCGKVINDMTEVGYMGPVDRTSTSCNPFEAFEVACSTCEGSSPL